MKTKAISLIAATFIAGCTATPEMIDAQKDRCTQVGYQPGTTEHAQCTERGTSQQQATQNAVAGAAAAGAINAAIINALW